jgi:DNA invertase Pin-like site-specific DNA recombinase
VDRQHGRTIDSLIRISRVQGRAAAGTLMSDDQQARSNERAIEAHGYAPGLTLDALNVSGGLVTESPKWQAALERVRTGASAGIAVAYVDRLSRDVKTGLAWVDELAAAGGIVISGGRRINVSNPHERSAFISELNMGELQLNVYKERSRETMQAVQARGITNRVPFGYMRNQRPDGTLIEPDADPKKLIADEQTAWIVRRIFEMRVDGSKWPAIQAWLEAEGLPSPTGRPMWTTSTLSTLVKNRIYLGEVKMGAVVTRGAHEALVSPRTFVEAQPRGQVIRTGRNVQGVAGGLLVCESCGRQLSVSGRGTGKATFYACRRTSSGGRCALPVTGDQVSIDTAIDALLLDLAEGRLQIDGVERQRERDRARERVAAAEYDLEQFVEGTSGSTASVIAKRLAALEAELEEARAALTAAEAKVAGVEAFPTSGRQWRSLGLARQRQAARGVIARIDLAPFPKGADKRRSVAADRLTVVWR